MSALARKAARDLLRMWGQVAAICLVIACGVATLVMSLSTLSSLENARRAYYDRYRFAHIFVPLKRAPLSLASRLAEIPGVGQVQARVAADVTLSVEGMVEPATGRLISLPSGAANGRAEGLNLVHLRSGRWPDPDRPGEVLAHEAFAEAHGLRPGDSVEAVIRGRYRRLTIVGIGLSPEFIYQIKPGDFIPDDRRFGVLWMPEEELAPAFDMDGAFNDAVLTLQHGATEEAVIREADRLTAPYGGAGAFGRDDQTSHRFITDELSQLRGMSVVPPSIFLSVAAGLVSMVLGRIVATQREQIAVLKAFGYTRWQVARHYLSMVLIMVAIGLALGVAAGARLGQGVAAMYAQFFRFPVFAFELDARAVGIAALVSAGAATLGAWRAVARAAALPPAEAMRPEAPPTFRPMALERLGLQRLLSASARMVLRDLERRPRRALTTVGGLSLATGVLVLGGFSSDAIDHLIDVEFFRSQRQDVTVTFVEPASYRSLHEATRLPGVIGAEAMRGVSVRLHAGNRSYRLGIQGLEPGSAMRPLLSRGEEEVPLPPDGLVLTTNLANILGVGPGDEIVAEVLEGRRPTRTLRVIALVDQYLGTAAYMDIAAAWRLLGEGPTLSGALLSVDPAATARLYTELRETPRVAGITIKRAALDSFQQTLAENILRMRAFNVMFGVIIAFGVVYNSARIALAERSHELATLRVLGFTRAEISAILLGELGLLTLVALPVGLLVGYGFAGVAVTALRTETHRIPLIVEPSTFGFAATIILLAALLSGLVVRRNLDRLDLVAVLKMRA